MKYQGKCHWNYNRRHRTMIEFILITFMMLSVIGMMFTGFNDPLSRRFWDQWRE